MNHPLTDPNVRLVEPSLSEQIAAVRREIDSLRQSYTELDGKIRDTDVVRDIACLEAAVRTLRRVRGDRRIK